MFRIAVPLPRSPSILPSAGSAAGEGRRCCARAKRRPSRTKGSYRLRTAQWPASSSKHQAPRKGQGKRGHGKADDESPVRSLAHGDAGTLSQRCYPRSPQRSHLPLTQPVTFRDRFSAFTTPRSLVVCVSCKLTPQLDKPLPSFAPPTSFQKTQGNSRRGFPSAQATTLPKPRDRPVEPNAATQHSRSLFPTTFCLCRWALTLPFGTLPIHLLHQVCSFPELPQSPFEYSKP